APKRGCGGGGSRRKPRKIPHMSAPKLTETQQIVLCAAARRADLCVVLPPRLKGATAQRVVKKLVDLGLIEEVRARGGSPVWRRDQDGCPIALRITRRKEFGSALAGRGKTAFRSQRVLRKRKPWSFTRAGLATTRGTSEPPLPVPALAPSRRRSPPCFGAPRVRSSRPSAS